MIHTLQVCAWSRGFGYHHPFAHDREAPIPMIAVKRIVAGLTAFLVLVVAPVNAQDAASVKAVLVELNADTQTVAGSEDAKSYRILFDAYLDLTKPPMPIGPEFNQLTIYPGMDRWTEVSGWAESNPGMAQAILKAGHRKMVGLPYGRDGVDSVYDQAGLLAVVGADGSLRNHEFQYLTAVDTIAAYAVAECYRQIEAGQAAQAMDLFVAELFVLRQFCDRQFLEEKLRHIQLLIDALSVLRDMMYTYHEQIGVSRLVKIAWREIPFLSPGRNHLFMPEGDRIVANALIDQVFDPRSGTADEDKFGRTFGEIQSKDEPMTRFGATRRWKQIATFHDSREASQSRLKLIYDDWWRRWRVRSWDEILNIKSEFDRTNPVRYAAVIYSIQDIEQVFTLRNLLVGAVDGTTLAAGLAAYNTSLGTYPDGIQKTFGQFARKREYSDPFDKNYQRFRYRRVTSRTSIDTIHGRVWIDPGAGLLYSVAQDHEDGRGRAHTADGLGGDVVYWPALRALEREQGLLH
jgi:hypothetical protein